MRCFRCGAAALALLLFASTGDSSEQINTPFPRRNPIVSAVQKTKQGIVTIQAARTNAAKDTVGTGVIIDERGYIVTNQHVIGASQNIHVRLHDGAELAAAVVWSDSACDLAVLRVRPHTKLQALELAPVADLMVGETVIAVGHPFGYTDTVSTGIISALDREITMPTGATLSGLIQTSAGINPGNSGGPLLNINGELIGINVALRDGAQGIAFAINAGTVKRALSEHLSSVKVAGVQHGLFCEEKILSETGDRQRVVVAANGAESDLAKGDEILTVGDRRIANAFDVERALWDKQAGDQVSVQVIRQGKELTATLVLSGANGATRSASAPPPRERRAHRADGSNLLVATPQR